MATIRKIGPTAAFCELIITYVTWETYSKYFKMLILNPKHPLEMQYGSEKIFDEKVQHLKLLLMRLGRKNSAWMIWGVIEGPSYVSGIFQFGIDSMFQCQ